MLFEFQFYAFSSWIELPESQPWIPWILLHTWEKTQQGHGHVVAVCSIGIYMWSSIRLKRFCAILARSRWNANWIHYCSLPYAHTGLFPWPFLLPVVRMTDHSTRREYRMCVFVPFSSSPARRRKRQTSLIAFLACTFLTPLAMMMMLYYFAHQWTSIVAYLRIIFHF